MTERRVVQITLPVDAMAEVIILYSLGKMAAFSLQRGMPLPLVIPCDLADIATTVVRDAEQLELVDTPAANAMAEAARACHD